MMPLRFHLDENVNGAVAHGLRLRGIDVTTTRDAGLIGATDEEHLAFAASQNRIVVTHDDDFLKLAGQFASHGGIVYSHPRHCSIGRLVHGLVALWRHRTQEAMRGHVEFL
jgi:predicted nuclease of predicted toxin-antitoxin system